MTLIKVLQYTFQVKVGTPIELDWKIKDISSKSGLLKLKLSAKSLKKNLVMPSTKDSSVFQVQSSNTVTSYVDVNVCQLPIQDSKVTLKFPWVSSQWSRDGFCLHASFTPTDSPIAYEGLIHFKVVSHIRDDLPSLRVQGSEKRVRLDTESSTSSCKRSRTESGPPESPESGIWSDSEEDLLNYEKALKICSTLSKDKKKSLIAVLVNDLE